MRELIFFFKEKKVSYPEFSRHLRDAYKPFAEKELIIPVSVFDNNSLSALEAIIKYLHENKAFRLSEIARLIKRDPRAVGVTYRFAKKKMNLMLKASVSKYTLPISILTKKKLSVLESIVYYLKNNYGLSYHDIAAIVRRDDSTVWTVYHRALKKLKKAEKNLG